MGIANLRDVLMERIKSELCVAAAGHPLDRVGETYQDLSDAFQASHL